MPARSKTKFVDFAAGSRLLAKSPRGGRPGRKLVEHTLDVIEAFEAFFGTACNRRNSRPWASFFGLRDIVAFVLNGLAACRSTIGEKRAMDSRRCCGNKEVNSCVTNRSTPC